MENVILFGINENAEKSVDKLFEINLLPVCFCDYNEHKENETLYNLPVLSLANAKKNYGTAKIYVTLDGTAQYDEIWNLIREGHFKKCQFINEVREKYFSCDYLESGFCAFSDGVKCCCGEDVADFDKLPVLPYDNELFSNPDIYIEKFFEQKEKLIADNKLYKKTCCTNCSYLREDYWPIDRKIRILNYSLDQSCNLKCNYCYKHQENYRPSRNNIDIIKIIQAIKLSKYVDLEYPVFYASGELCIQPNANEILDNLSEYEVSIFTNATKYNQKLHDLIKKPKSCAVISLDSGTRETYEKVKGYDLFEEVCNNIKKYASDGGHIILKYIIKEENTNSVDLDGFINLCVSCGIKNIRISRDWRIGGVEEETPELKSASARMLYKAHKNNIKCYTNGTTVCQEWI
ncbi:MAG: radical SAM protein [Eisenbergiella massiliensis]|uniref:radical SAM protein n=1 Tax=Eisenbergiella massiliensis TaxID=1720294 RepID=UPI0039918BAD